MQRYACKCLVIALILVLLISVAEFGACTKPAPAPALAPVPTPTSVYPSPSDVANNKTGYDDQMVKISGQVFGIGDTRLLLDSVGGVIISGNIDDLASGFYELEGIYDAPTNTLEVLAAKAQEAIVYQSIQQAQREIERQFDIRQIPVILEGLVATLPASMEVPRNIGEYLDIPNLNTGGCTYPYLLFANDSMYLVLFDHAEAMPADFKFGSTSLTLSAGRVSGGLVRSRFDDLVKNFKTQIHFHDWAPGDVGGVILASSIAPLTPVRTTVGDILAHGADYEFKRVAVHGSYLVAAVRVGEQTGDGGDAVPIGAGLLLDKWPEIFKDDPAELLKTTLVTLNPENRTWQLRQGEVTGTVIYPNQTIMRHLDKVTGGYASKIVKPILIVDDTHDDDVITVDKVAELCPVPGRGGNPQKYHGKVVQFGGYAASVTVSLSNIIFAITSTIPEAQVIPNSPVDLKMAIIAVYDSIPPPPNPLYPDLIMVCIGDNLPETSLPAGVAILLENLPVHFGHYQFTVAVTDLPPLLRLVVPNSMRDFVANVETGFFLLNCKLLDLTPPPWENLIPTVNLGGVLIHPHPNIYSPPTFGPPMPPPYPPLPQYAICPLKLNMENTTDAEVIVSNIDFDVYILGQYAGDGFIQGPYTIPAHETLSIKEDFRADFSTAGEIVMRFFSDFSFESTPAENLNITLVGSALVTSGTQTKVISFGEIPTATTSYSLTTSVSPSGAGSVSPSGGQYKAGTSVTLTATPASGYIFDHWSGDASGSSPTITVTMDSNKSIIASFRAIQTPTPTPTPTPKWTQYSFTVPSFGKVSLSKNLSVGQTVTGSFSIGGSGFDIRFYVIAPSGNRIVDKVSFGESFSFQAGESGTYQMCFENKPPWVLSAPSSKPITLNVDAGGWQID